MSYLINPYRYASAGGGGACTTPEADYTGLAITQLTTSGCYRKPILTASSVSHSIGSDTNLRFWVNCKLGNDTSSTFGAAADNHMDCNFTEVSLAQGRIFTKSQLLAGIDLLAYDSTNAAAQDASDDIAIGWNVRVTAVDITDCSISICADTGGNIQNLSQYESLPYDGPALYTGSGTFPQFDTGQSEYISIDTGETLSYVIMLTAGVDYYADEYSYGDDSFGSTTFKIEIQYDTSCDTSGGCGSYSWQDGIDNDTFLAAGSGGGGVGGGGENYKVVEADCWNEEYIFVRFRIVAQGSCGSALAGAWSDPTNTEVDTWYEGVNC